MTYNGLIRAVRNFQPELALEIFQDMLRQNIAPDASTFSAVIRACETDSHPELPLHIFETMKQQGVVPDATTYADLISACRPDAELYWNQPEHALVSAAAIDHAGSIIAGGLVAGLLAGTFAVFLRQHLR